MARTKNRDSIAIAMDPHRLAHHYIDHHCTDAAERRTLRFWRGEFWRYEEGRYRPLSYSEVTPLLTKAIKQHVDAVPLVDGNGKVHRVTKGTVFNVANAVAAELHIADTTEQPAWVDGGGGHTNYVAMRNGLLDLDAAGFKAGALKPLTPRWFTAVSLPFDFAAEATCPRWEAFLARVLECDVERIALLQEFMGYLLTPDTSLHKFLVLEGEGANGKSVVLEIVEAMVGRANASHVPVEVFGERFQLTMTLNRLVNIAPEVNENARLNEGVLKQFIAGDRMYFDRKGVSGIDAKPTARLMMATNNRPPVSDRSDGVWRRMLYLPFRVTIPPQEQDARLADKLKMEIAGILNWALEGRRRLYAAGRFTIPSLSTAAMQEYRRESNPAGIFLREECSLQCGARVRCDVLYSMYREWAKSNGHNTLDSGQFGKEVKRVYSTIEKRRPTGADGNREWVYDGLSVAQGNAIRLSEVA